MSLFESFLGRVATQSATQTGVLPKCYPNAAGAVSFPPEPTNGRTIGESSGNCEGVRQAAVLRDELPARGPRGETPRSGPAWLEPHSGGDGEPRKGRPRREMLDEPAAIVKAHHACRVLRDGAATREPDSRSQTSRSGSCHQLPRVAGGCEGSEAFDARPTTGTCCASPARPALRGSSVSAGHIMRALGDSPAAANLVPTSTSFFGKSLDRHLSPQREQAPRTRARDL